MAQKIVWTERASSDVEAIFRYLSRRNPEAAARILSNLFARVELLLTYPEAGSSLSELRHEGWRKLIYRRWKVVYKVDDQAVIVGRVWPAALGEVDLKAPLD